MAESRFPLEMDAFMPMIDGLQPITAADLNYMAHAIKKTSQAMGYGQTRYFLNWGPKGGNASVAERLDTFLNPDGSIRDVVLVGGSCKAGDFSDTPVLGNVGKYIPFPTTVSGAGVPGYFVLFASQSPVDSSTGLYSMLSPDLYAVTRKNPDYCRVAARYATRAAIPLSAGHTVVWQALVVGPGAYF